MSLVKWCSAYEIKDNEDGDIDDAVPVIPLAALTEVVEGRLGMLETYLRSARYAEALELVVNTRNAITQLTAHGKEGV